MIPVLILLNLAIFAVAAAVMAAMRTGPSATVKARLQALEREPGKAQIEETADIRPDEPAGGIWLNRFLVRFRIPPATRLLFLQAGVKLPAEHLLLVSLAGWLAGACAIYMRTGSPRPAILLSAGFAALPLMVVYHRRSKRFAKFEQQLPEALDLLVAALRVGHSLISAIGELGQDAAEPLAGEFRKVFDEHNFGLDFHIAMTNLSIRVPLPDVRIFVAATLIQKESGGNLAEVLANFAKTTRSRFQLKKQIMVHTAQGRLTGSILSLLPVVLCIGMYLVNPGGVSVLWSRPIGLKMIWAGAAMIAVGWLIIQKIIRIRV